MMHRIKTAIFLIALTVVVYQIFGGNRTIDVARDVSKENNGSRLLLAQTTTDQTETRSAPTPVKGRPATIQRRDNFFFDHQYQGWHYFSQGPGAFKKKVMATPVPTRKPPPLYPMIPPRSETSYRSIVPVRTKTETEYAAESPERKDSATTETLKNNTQK